MSCLSHKLETSEGPHAVENILPDSCTQKTTSQWLQGLQPTCTDIPHHEDPEETHLGEALAYGEATPQPPLVCLLAPPGS